MRRSAVLTLAAALAGLAGIHPATADGEERRKAAGKAVLQDIPVTKPVDKSSASKVSAPQGPAPGPVPPTPGGPVPIPYPSVATPR